MAVDATFTAGEGLAVAVERVADECVSLAASGATALCLTDAAAGGERAAIPSLLALAAAHGRLVEQGLRTACSLLVSSDEARDTHMVATLVGFGADVVCPRLALETARVSRRPTRSEVTGPRPRRRRAACSTRSRTACSR